MTSIAIVNGGGRWDGITQSAEPYPEALGHLGYSTSWYQLADYRDDGYLPPGATRFHGIGFPNRIIDMGLNRLLVFPRRLRRLTEDIVLLTEPTLGGMLPSPQRVVVYVHDLRPLTDYGDRLTTRMMYNRILPRLRHAWRIIVSSNYIRDQLIQRGSGADRIRVVPETHGLGFHPGHIQQSLDRVRDRRQTRVLFVGTDRPYKNLDLVLRIAKEMETRGDNWYTFTIVSKLRDGTRHQIRDLGLKHTSVLADVPSMGAIYEASDILLMPSSYEGFGRPLIEAMAYGIPIIANNIDPIREVLGDSGMLLYDGSVTDWAEMLSVLEDRSVMEVHARKSLERGRAFRPSRFEEALRSALAP